MNTSEIFWKAKLAAWVHDPAEKPLVLFREAHEAGTVRNLCQQLFGTERIPDGLAAIVKKADRWSAAADRPDLPWKTGEPLPEWSRVSFTKSPELVHPVSPGVKIDIKTTFRDVSVGELKAVSTDHFKQLIFKDDAGPDMRNTFLRFWRFGPETPASGLNLLWQLLPADTRSPDHTIWDHLKLCSAFSGIFALDDEPTLLVVSLGPVQGFIAQARSTSDLWAGSHFLSQLCWQAMLPIAESYGPDAILFPDLHRVPVVDQWLVEQGIWPDDMLKPWEYSSKEKIETIALDRDPRMSAALPNRFVAVVPSKHIEDLTAEIRVSVRAYTPAQAELAAGKVFKNGLPEITKNQIKEQMKDFPEIYWSAVPWSVVKEAGGKVDPEKLFGMLEQFLPDSADISTKKETWDILAQPVKNKSGEWTFYEPNRGAAYTHLYGLTDRIHSAVKTSRPFEEIKQEGYRCTICGEREWLTDNRNDLFLPPGEKRNNTIWSKAAASIVRKGEHLCSWCTLKRFWPSVFPEAVGAEGKRRFVVSTHTMALAPTVEAILDKANSGLLKKNTLKAANQLAPSMEAFDRPAFPRRLWRKIERLAESDKTLSDVLSRLPAFLDFMSDAENQGDEVKEDKKRAVKELLGDPLETYYALIMMDGDRMGEWVSGANPEQLPRYRDILHSITENLLDDKFHNDMDIQNFLKAKRPNTPARHQAISRALNYFSMNLARIVVEEIFTGKLIYSGGDDLLAMVSVHDLPGLMLALRSLYSGVMLDSEEKWKMLTKRETEYISLYFRDGYALLSEYKDKKSLYATMGPKATASIGAVVAHHKSPLSRVLRSLREAEQTAKRSGGRDAFCLRIEKRSGGTSQLVGRWWHNNADEILPVETTLGVIMQLRDVLATKGVSRRAAYVIHELLRDLPPDKNAISNVISYRLKRQGVDDKEANRLAESIIRLGVAHEKINEAQEDSKPPRGEPPSMNRWLQDFFITAEFLARRMDSMEGGDAE
ncbi:MAG: type III-B CRISPR-associated protein Cas10/Cmr2 [Deferribacteres bacterium]|nr:type III-B CRISPR-associated protein Cas10/Cmr2 [Deferribacteres bacterium]